MTIIFLAAVYAVANIAHGIMNIPTMGERIEVIESQAERRLQSFLALPPTVKSNSSNDSMSWNQNANLLAADLLEVFA